MDNSLPEPGNERSERTRIRSDFKDTKAEPTERSPGLHRGWLCARLGSLFEDWPVVVLFDSALLTIGFSFLTGVKLGSCPTSAWWRSIRRRHCKVSSQILQDSDLNRQLI